MNSMSCTGYDNCLTNKPLKPARILVACGLLSTKELVKQQALDF